MLKLLDITKEYKVDEESTLALHDVSIEFRKNEFVSILGPSGCGKTTLLNIIGGLDRYTSGDIQIDGISTREYDDVDWDTYRNRRIGFVFQSYNLIPHMNVLKNVSLCLTLAGVGKEERKERALEALRQVGLETQARKKPNQLSGGQMQRVAIARALVNNPDIILADEPTGALDSESGIQVMELLKEVAKDRLVIMVTHNPILAEQYSTRIVYLKDGEVTDDTQPYDSAAETEANNATADQTEAVVKKTCAAQRLKLRLQKIKAKEKSSMSVKTAISLSWNNLLSKKGRTFLTSTAGSIGIIGIILVLALSNGVSGYINTIEENALSQYPIAIERSNLDIGAVMGMLQPTDKHPSFPDSEVVNTNKVLGNILDNFTDVLAENDLRALKSYIDKNFDQDLGVVKYEYGTSFNAYAADPNHADKYMKVNPYTDLMDATLESLEDVPGLGTIIAQYKDMLSQFGNALTGWDEMTTNQKLLDQQYDLLGSSRWPQTAEEVVIVLDQTNSLNDFSLFMLGLKSTDDLIKALAGDKAFSNTKFTVDELLQKEYKVLTNANYYYERENSPGYFDRKDKAEQSKEFVDANYVLNLKVVGVIRPKPGAIVTSINGVLGYTHALTETLITKAEESQAVNAQMNAYLEENPEGSTRFEAYESAVAATYPNPSGGTEPVMIKPGDLVMDEKSHKQIMLQLGVVDLDDPVSIKIFCTSFESKDKIVEFIARYNSETGKSVKYTDMLAMIMGYVGTLTSTVTSVLVGFAAISLLVSTIMIAIIIYTSVLERRKEIGVLRSLGARKKDISRVFLAESSILGGYSGIIGLLVSYILSLVGNAVIALYFDSSTLISITWWHCLMMLAISIILSMLAGFIPSRIAAKKDPAIALRSE